MIDPNPSADEHVQATDDASRAALRASLLVEMDRLWIRRRRRNRAVGIAALPVLALATFGAWNLLQSSADQPDSGQLASVMIEGTERELQAARAPQQGGPAEVNAVRITHIQTDPLILDRYRILPSVDIALITDAQLVQSLAQSGIRAGVVRVGNQVRLIQPDRERMSQPSSQAPAGARFSAS